ncbi:MAG: DUF4272 domain-containing protein [Polyangiaceae bacterium]|nr:DUF4272 domain-containing protein [Polyangiaceae bacterium]MCL4756678.1 DUF4272 domain-containing protein [Myxococcales bacterium]
MAELDTVKHENEARIRAWGLEVNPGLPLIESLDEVSPRTARDVAARGSALGYVVGIGFGADPVELRRDLERFGLWDWVSARERGMLTEGASRQDEIDCTWLTEGIQALGYCLGIVDMDPSRHCDDDLADRFPLGVDPQRFISAATLRPLDEIQAQVDLHYRLHWYVRQCELTGVPPKFVDGGVIRERRRALDWVYGVEADWDDVPCDT